jgi:two-component system, chemotaxis family, response regulator PixH
MTTVLLVDDTLSQLDLMEVYLRESGYTVIRINEPKAALKQAIQYKPDVIVTDIVMPGMSGFELCRSFKKHSVTNRIPIVICSSKNQEIDRIWGMKQGATAYLIKPFSKEQLIRTIELAMIA